MLRGNGGDNDQRGGGRSSGLIIKKEVLCVGRGEPLFGKKRKGAVAHTSKLGRYKEEKESGGVGGFLFREGSISRPSGGGIGLEWRTQIKRKKEVKRLLSVVGTYYLSDREEKEASEANRIEKQVWEKGRKRCLLGEKVVSRYLKNSLPQCLAK